MYDIKPLEEEWERYRKGRRRPYMILAALLLIAGVGGGVLYYTKGIDALLSDRNSSDRNVGKEAMEFVENKPLARLEVPEDAEEAEPVAMEDPAEIVEDLPLSADRPKRKKPRVKMNIITTEMPSARKKSAVEEKPHKRMHLDIKETSASTAYRDVAARFRETQDPDDSLFLARSYYHIGNYKKAEYWALQTNNVNSSIEESILIFAKAKAKRGHKNEAIRVLRKYIKGSGSQEAQALLNKIKKGKL